MNWTFRDFIIIIFIIFSTINIAQEKEIIAYFPQWRVENNPYYIKHLEKHNAADKITIINYAFAEPEPDSLGNIVPILMNDYYDYQQVYSADMSIDGVADDSTQTLRGHFNQLRKLKERHPQIRIMISLGGWVGSVYFSDAALTEESRELFVDYTIDMFIKGNLPLKNGAGGKGVAEGIFDGIDIDWEYPIEGGIEGIRHNEKDKENLTKLYQLFREKLDEINPELLLTAAMPARHELLDNYNVNLDSKILDWYTIMSYDFVGAWDPQSGHHAKMYTPDKPGDAIIDSFDSTVKLFRDKYGVQPEKIVPGVAFYGRGWKVENVNKNGLYGKGAPARGGSANYVTLKRILKEDEFHWDTEAMAPYAFDKSDSSFWTFDDEQSLALKSQYADAYNLKGIMFWEVTGDDSTGALINAIANRGMENNSKSSININSKHIDGEIIYPEENENYKAGSDIKIITKVGKSVVNVEFYVDGKLIGRDTKNPFNWIWFKAEKGTHMISIIIEDKSGTKFKADEKIITVN